MGPILCVAHKGRIRVPDKGSALGAHDMDCTVDTWRSGVLTTGFLQDHILRRPLK